jgi:trans-2,3-dihydro-3-hydroxyanthranilate isomerase
MFGPCIGIPEDPATGAASGPLGAYLLQHNAVSVDNASRLVNLQGVRIGRSGRIYISLSSRAGVLEEVRVGGEEGKFAGKGLQSIDEDDDMLAAVARELVEKNGIGDSADAI